MLGNKLATSYSSNAGTCLENVELRTDMERMRDRIQSLVAAFKTYGQRIDNEGKHAAEQRKALQEKYDREHKTRMELEDKLRVGHRRPPSQKRGRGARARGVSHSNFREAGKLKSNHNSNQIPPIPVSPMPLEQAKAPGFPASAVEASNTNPAVLPRFRKHFEHASQLSALEPLANEDRRVDQPR